MIQNISLYVIEVGSFLQVERDMKENQPDYTDTNLIKCKFVTICFYKHSHTVSITLDKLNVF